jgi:hypothetical protein
VIDPSLVAVPKGVGIPLRIPYPTIPFLIEAFTASITRGMVAMGREPSLVFVQPTTKFKRKFVEVSERAAVLRLLLR